MGLSCRGDFSKIIKVITLCLVYAIRITAQHACAQATKPEISTRVFMPASLAKNQICYNHEEEYQLKCLKDFVAIPSLSLQESDAAEYLYDLALRLGLKPTWLLSDQGDPNVLISIFDLQDEKSNVIFLHHMDVVDPGKLEDWIFPPFGAVIDGQYLYGRGVYDNKGPLMANLMAISNLANQAREEDWPINISILALCGEEIFHPGGAKYISENYLDLLKPMAFIGEGSSGVKSISKKKPDVPIFGISTISKRALWVRLELNYWSHGHGSMPPKWYPAKEMNMALHRLLNAKPLMEINAYNSNLLSAIGDLEGGLEGTIIKNLPLMKSITRRKIRKHPLLSALLSNTLTLTKFSTGPAEPNTIAPYAVAELDCRLMPGTNTDAFIDWMKTKLKNDKIQITIINETPDAPPSSANHFVYDAIVQAVQSKYPESPVSLLMLPVTNDSNFFRAKGYPVFCFVPFVMDPAYLACVHAANERLPVRTYLDGIKLSEELIQKISQKSMMDKSSAILQK